MGDEKTQLDLFKDMLKEADEQVTEIKNLTKESLASYGFNFDVVDIFDHFTEEQVKEFNDAQILAIYTDYHDDSTGVTYPENYDERIAKIKESLLAVAPECNYYNGVLEKRLEISKQYQAMIDELVAYGESPEGREKAHESYENLKEKLATETDPVKKAEIETKLRIYDESKTLSFVFDRIDKFSDKEIRSISDTMFENARFNVAMSRCEKVLKKLRINGDVLHSFVNLEEKFLGEEYYPFNNLFLVFTIRYIAYCDVTKKDNAAFVRILISKLNKLVRNSFSSKEEEEYIIDIIKKFDDKFTEYRDLFVRKNKADPDSEYRREIDNRKREATIARIKDIAKENGYDVLPELPYPELVKWARDVQEKGFLMHWFETFGVEYNPEMSLEELRAIREDMRDAVIAERNKDDSEDDGVVPYEEDEDTESDDESSDDESFEPTPELIESLSQASGIPVPDEDKAPKVMGFKYVQTPVPAVNHI